MNQIQEVMMIIIGYFNEIKGSNNFSETQLNIIDRHIRNKMGAATPTGAQNGTVHLSAFWLSPGTF